MRSTGNQRNQRRQEQQDKGQTTVYAAMNEDNRGRSLVVQMPARGQPAQPHA
jgi:hypothetical protein